MKATLIVPTYNEASNVGMLMASVRREAPQVDILIVDDNSPDGTSAIVEKLSAVDSHVHLYKRAGKEGLGVAYIAAFKKVLAENVYDLVIMMDADFSHDPKYLAKMLQLAESHDIVVGSRYVPGGGTVGWELWRRALVAHITRKRSKK